MNVRIPTLLAVALSAACLSPLAAGAQDRTTQALDQANEAAMPPPVNDADPRGLPVDPEVNAMTQPPQPAQPDLVPRSPIDPVAGPERTAQRSQWTVLDTDGDGRISAGEGGIDADFNANFEMMDRDGDGYVSQTEFAADAATEVDMEPEPELEEEDGQ